jgi:hypothetical protein
MDRAVLEQVPEKHALGLDPMGGNRFSEKGHATTNEFRAQSMTPMR